MKVLEVIEGECLEKEVRDDKEKWERGWMKRRNQPQRSPHGKTSRNQGRTTENVLRSGKKWEDGGICKKHEKFHQEQQRDPRE